MGVIREFWFEIVVGLAFVFLLIFSLVLSARLKAYKKLARLVKGGTVEQHINELGKHVTTLQSTVDRVEDRLAATQRQLALFPQHWHLVRYNAFERTGSDLSFSLALLNDNTDGFVLTGIFGREDTRVYAKPIQAGKSRYSLSEEENKAIALAIKDR